MVSVYAGREQGRGSPPAVAVAALFLINAVAFVDRVALGVLGPALRKDLALSGAQFGVLAGLAFTLVFALAALPVARAADRWGATPVLAATAAAWGLATFAGGLAQGFWSLAASRTLLAVGEAGTASICYAAAVAVLPSAWRTAGLALIVSAGPIGSSVGAIALSALGERYGWRAAMQGAGVAALALAPLALIAVRTGRLRTPLAGGGLGWRACGRIWARADTRRLALAYAGAATAMFSGMAWLPQIFVRAGVTLAEAGRIVGLSVLVGGLAGALLVPAVAKRATAGDAGAALRWASRLVPLGAALIGLCLAAPAQPAAVVLLALGWAPFAAILPAVAARIPDLASDLGVAEANAAVLLVGNLVGASAGAALVGLADDLLSPSVGAPAAALGLGVVLLCACAALAPVALQRRPRGAAA